MSTEYEKINSLWKRDTKGKIIPGTYATEELAYLAEANAPFRWFEKIDGTNARIEWHPGADMGNPIAWIGGRTANAQIPLSLLTVLVQTWRDAPWATCFPDLKVDEETTVTLYGEGYGAGIQKGGGNYRPDKGFVLFDCMVGPYWLSRENVVDVATKLGIDVVQEVDVCSIEDAIWRVQLNNWTSAWPGVTTPEGLVGRPTVPLFDRYGRRIATKVKWCDVQELGA